MISLKRIAHSKSTSGVHEGDPAFFVRCCPRHPAREIAFNKVRKAFYCGRCGAFYTPFGELVELEAEVPAFPVPTPTCAINAQRVQWLESFEQGETVMR